MKQRLDPRTERRWRALMEEYNEPTRDIIQGMRDQGATWRTVANVLKVAPSTLITWRRWLDLPVDGTLMWDDLSRELRRGRKT